jgi:CMP-N-acetylneuraminic acid synthetase
MQTIEADVYILTHVTSPFLQKSSIVTAIDKIRYEGYDSAFSAQEIKEFSWYNGQPLNYNFDDVVLTQNLKPVYVETSGFYMFKREVMMEHGRRIGFNPYMHFVDAYEAVDIDTREDFEFAKVVAKYLSEKDGESYV